MSVPYFEFTTVSVHGQVNNMHNDDLSHRAKANYLNDGDCEIQCSCRASWIVIGIDALTIQQSFEEHLKRGG